MGVLLAVAGAYGTYLLYTALTFGWRGVGLGPRPQPRDGMPPVSARLRQWLAQAGLGSAKPTEMLGAMLILSVVGAVVAYAIFGGVLPAMATGVFAATAPVAMYRAKRQQRLAQAREAWPRMIEEIRLQTGSLGRSIPLALFEVGRRGPQEMRPAFAAAEREWLISTDFARTLSLLKQYLADPTADATCETLLVANEIGGTDIDQRLAALVEDRVLDLQGRKDAQSKQAGVRFARRFVLLVPAGMALAGLSIGTGRSAYETAAGQFAVVVGVLVIVGCWLWAGRLLRLPEEQRVFHE